MLERALCAIRPMFVSLKGLERTTGAGAPAAGARNEGADGTALVTGEEGLAGLAGAMRWTGAGLLLAGADGVCLEDDGLLGRVLRSKVLPFWARPRSPNAIKATHAAPRQSRLQSLSVDMAILLSSTLVSGPRRQTKRLATTIRPALVLR